MLIRIFKTVLEFQIFKTESVVPNVPSVDQPAPNLSKGPVGESVVAGSEGDTGGQKQKICDS